MRTLAQNKVHELLTLSDNANTKPTVFVLERHETTLIEALSYGFFGTVLVDVVALMEGLFVKVFVLLRCVAAVSYSR